jgi:tetratricopeptide (TPR) repeat protein
MSEPIIKSAFGASPHYQKYQTLLFELHRLGAQGQFESAEAEAIRAQMDSPWTSLSETERARLANLSEDLYADRDEGGPHQPDPKAIEAARSAFEAHHWERFLEALRLAQGAFPASVVAYMRGRAWSELEEPYAASIFFNRALELEPANHRYRLLALHARFKINPAEATQEAERLLTEGEVHPELAIGSAKVLLDAARGRPTPDSKSVYQRVVDALRPILERTSAPGTELLSSLRIAGYLSLGIAYDRLGQAELARKAYDTAVAKDPAAEGPLLARALFLLDHAPESAYHDMQALIDRNTSSPYPFLFLAGRALQQGNFQECINLCTRGLERASSDRATANLLEWIAIASHELHAPDAHVRMLFQNALRLDPMNDRIRRNYAVFDQHTRQPVRHSEFSIESSEVTADLASDLQRRIDIAA